MTAPGAGQNINLAALWIPVMPETSHMGEEMRKAGGEAKRQFEQGFNSGASPESMGSTFGSKLHESITKELGHFELPLGMSSVVEKMGADIDKNLVNKLRGDATDALKTYRSEYENLSATAERVAEATKRATEAARAQAQAEADIKLARDNGINSAQVLIPLMDKQTQAARENTTAQREQVTAQKDLTAAHTNTGAALDDYNTKLGHFNEVGKEAGSTSNMMAGLMGGAVVAGVQLAVGAIDSLVEAIGEGFEKSIEITEELVKQALELGETYEHIGIQIHEFSTASGEDFESMEAAAQHVFSTLDVAGNDVGKTMATLSSVMGAPGEEIEALTRHVTDLQGRFSSLKAQDLGAIFLTFKTPAEEADSALSSLLQSARNSGQDFGVFTSALSGNVAVTLQEAGLNLQQAGAFMGDLMKMGEPGRQAMTGLASAMKEFGKEGLSFGDGMKLAGQRLKELGDTAEGQDLAEKLFGTRNWIVAKNAVQDYLSIVEKAPDAYNANSSSLDEFISQTETLDNKVEAFKHQAQDAFKPFGDLAKTAAISGLNSLSTWFSEHHHEIVGDIKEWGDKLIGALPQIQEFAVDAIRIFGDLAQAIAVLLLPIGNQLGLAGAGMLALTGHFKEAGDLIAGIGKLDVATLTGGIASTVNDMADKIQGIKINVDGIKDGFDQAADSANRIPTTVGTSAMPQTAGGTGPFGPAGGLAPGYSGGGGSFDAPGSSGGASTSGESGYGHPGVHIADWDAIAGKESGGRWNQVLTTGITEGGGLQIKPETWQMYGGLEYAPKPYQASKELQEVVGERILNGWNGIQGQGPKAWQNGENYVGYAQGGPVGRMVTQGSGNGDDVAALLGKGEYVWDADTVDKYGWLITALHRGAKGFDTGGDVNPYGRNTLDQSILAGVPSGHYAEPGQERDNLAKGMADCSSAIEALVNHLEGGSLTAPSGMFTGNESEYLAAHGFVPGEGGPGDFRVGFNSHHTQATLPGGTPFNWGSEEMAQGRGIGGTGADDPAFTSHYYMPMRQGGPNGGYPGLPGQFGGGGAYGGETYDQQYAAQKAVQEAQDHQADLDYRVQQSQKKVDDLKAEIAKPDDAKLGMLGMPVAQTPAEADAAAKKKKTLNDELDAATHDLTVAQREQAEQGAVVTEAQRKQQEAGYRKPSGTGQSAEGKAGETLGQGLLGGIGEELGLGDVLGKSPLDWGIVKLAEGLLNYGNGLGDAIFGKSGGLGGPGGSGGMASGMATGMLGSLGIKLPNAAISASPNVIPAPVGSPASGQGSGTLPGPVINNDNSINIQAGVEPGQIMAPVQEQQNSSNSAAYQYQGSLPAQ